MPTLINPNEEPGLSADRSVEARPDRIIRYCLGKPLTPSAEEDNESARGKDDTDTSANVPPFGRVKRWMNEEQHRKLWAFDIERLKHAADASGINELQPDLEEDEELKSRHLCGESFAQLSNVANQILYSLWVFSYEDEALLRQGGISPPDPKRAAKMSWNLQRIRGRMPDLPGQSFKAITLGKEAGKPPEKPARPPRTQLTVTKTEQYCYVVDEITSILAHIACNSIGSSYWRLVVLACLAKISTKMKVLATRLPDAIDEAIPRIGRFRENTTEEYDPASKQPVVVRHCHEYIVVSTWLVDCIEHVLCNFGAEKPLYEDRNSLNLCTLVYEAGTRGIHTQIYEGKWGNISGSTDRLGIHWTLNSLEVGSKLLQTLPPPSQITPTVERGQKTTTQATANPQQTCSKILPEIEEKKSIEVTIVMKNRHLVKDIRNIIDFVVIMIPLSLAWARLSWAEVSPVI